MAFLRAVRELYSVAVRKILPPEAVRKQVIDNYRATLREVVEARIVTETPKARILAMEVPRYWEITGNSLYYALTEQHEITVKRLQQQIAELTAKAEAKEAEIAHLRNAQPLVAALPAARRAAYRSRPSAASLSLSIIRPSCGSSSIFQSPV